MTKILTSMFALTLTLAMAAPALAATLFFDDFDGYTGFLSGNAANTGQVWDLPVGNAEEFFIDSEPGQGGTLLRIFGEVDRCRLELRGS